MSYSPQGQPMIGSEFGPPRIRFAAIGEAWNLFTAQMGVWIGIIFIQFAVIGVVYLVSMPMVWTPWFIELQNLKQGEQPPFPPLGPTLIVFLGLIVLSAFLQAGIWKAAVRQVRGETIGIGDLFSGGDCYASILLYMLILFAGAVAIGAIPVLGLCFSPLAILVLQSLLLLTVPLIVDQRLTVFAAMGRSWSALTSQIFPALGFLLVTGLIASAGSLCCIGGLFTVPLFVLSHAIVYRDFFIEPAAAPAGYPPTAPPPPPPPPVVETAPPPPPPPPPPVVETAPPPPPPAAAEPPASGEPPASEPEETPPAGA